MGEIVIKPDRDRDEYVIWNTTVEAPTGFGPRAEIEVALWEGWRREHPHSTPNPGYGPTARMARADECGSSATNYYEFGYWDHLEFIYEQRGLLRREDLVRACDLLHEGREAEVHALLRPFENVED